MRVLFATADAKCIWVVSCSAKVVNVAWLIAIEISCSSKGFSLLDPLVEPLASQRRYLASAACFLSLAENDKYFYPCTNKSLVIG
jgi:hypothetical protein